VDAPDRTITSERFAQGMTFEAYLRFIATPENLRREAGWWRGPERWDGSERLRQWHARLVIDEARAEAICWLAAQPGGPARVLVISEEWSSDCRRDVPMLARLAEAGGLELRIFPRDGERVGRGPRADPAESPSADLVNLFLREADGRTWQSIPVAAFYTRDFRYLYHYTELPAVYRKECLAAALQAPRSGATPEAAWSRFLEEWGRDAAGAVLPRVGRRRRGRDPLGAPPADRATLGAPGAPRRHEEDSMKGRSPAKRAPRPGAAAGSPYGYPFWDWVAREDPEYVRARKPLAELSIGEGKELSVKYREMVIIGILAYRGRQDGVVAHMRRAVEHGATKRELLEALQSAAVPGGGPTFSTGVQALMQLEREGAFGRR
jgi:alkylhydroperoxidase/carboxymuconolactone decarboxylase family protein YurZ